MTIQDIFEEIPFPALTFGFDGTDLTTEFLIDASGEKVAFIFQIPKAGDIAKVAFMVPTHTTGGNLDCRLETVSTTTGQPTGTLIAAGANHVQNITAAGWQTVTLDTAPTVTRSGQAIALVLDATAAVDFTILASGDNQAQLPYTSHFTASSWLNNKKRPIFGLEYSGGDYPLISGVNPYKTAALKFFTSSSTPDELALKFKLPIGFRVSGFYLFASAGTQAANTEFILYDSDGSTVLETLTPDFDIQSTSNEGAGLHYFRFANSETLLADTFYFLSVKAGANSVTLMEIDYESAAVMDASPGGDNAITATQVNAGGFSDEALKMIGVGVLIDGLDLPAGGGAASILGAGADLGGGFA